MDKHTFKVGDRVFFMYDKREMGTIITRHKEIPGNWLVLRDDGYSAAWAPYYTYRELAIRHDTDFQVGDWVRYEGVHPRVVSPLLEGKVGKIEYLNGDSCAGIPQFHMQSGGVVYKENLVKIQPPQEDKKNMCNVFSITHEKYDVVQGVHQVAPGCYRKNGANYYHGEGWRETEEWVKIEVRKSQWNMVNKSVGMLEVQKESDTYPDTCALAWRYPQ